MDGLQAIGEVRVIVFLLRAFSCFDISSDTRDKCSSVQSKQEYRHMGRVTDCLTRRGLSGSIHAMVCARAACVTVVLCLIAQGETNSGQGNSPIHD